MWSARGSPTRSSGETTIRRPVARRRQLPRDSGAVTMEGSAQRVEILVDGKPGVASREQGGSLPGNWERPGTPTVEISTSYLLVHGRCGVFVSSESA